VLSDFFPAVGAEAPGGEQKDPDCQWHGMHMHVAVDKPAAEYLPSLQLLLPLTICDSVVHRPPSLREAASSAPSR
jgi:hypothetical protein